MPLFADADVNGLTVAMAVIAAVSAALSSYLSYRAGRDKLQLDAEKAKMQGQIQALQDDVADCKQERADQNVTIRALRAAMQRHEIECPPPHGRSG